MRPTLLAALAILAFATPTLAASSPRCPVYPNGSGIQISFGIQIGKPFTETEMNEHYFNRLRGMGLDVINVSQWQGCIRAIVRGPDGKLHTQFYDPNTYELVPLDR
jgi:hypothetical protein